MTLGNLTENWGLWIGAIAFGLMIFAFFGFVFAIHSLDAEKEQKS